ncbi:cell division protein FtsZ, partial [mine drainage metagenome]
TTLLDAFKSANQVLQGAVQGIAELITRPGLINVDFADVRTVMSETGMAMMGTGTASGEGRARAAAEAAVSSPLLEEINLAGAHGILVNVTAGMDLSIGEFQEVGQIVKEFASEDATVVVGTVIDPDMSNLVRVTVVATGLGRPAVPNAARPTIGAGREREAAPGAMRAPSRRCVWCAAMRPRAATTPSSTGRRCSARGPWATDCARTSRRTTCWTFRRSCAGRRTEPRIGTAPGRARPPCDLVRGAAWRHGVKGAAMVR